MGRPRKNPVAAPSPAKEKDAAKVQDLAVVTDPVVVDSASTADETEAGSVLLDADQGAPVTDIPETEKAADIDNAGTDASVDPVLADYSDTAEEVQADPCSYLLTNLSPCRVSFSRLSVEAGQSIPVDVRSNAQLEKIQRTVGQLNELSARNGHGKRLVFEKA